MYRHVIVLPDGREISSGTAGSAVRSVVLTRCVSAGREPEPGAVCAAMLEARLFGGRELTAGMEVALYRMDEAQNREPLGLFTLQEVSRPSANTLRFTAFDRVTRLDRDLTAWLAALEGWPYRLLDLAKMVCAECGLDLKNETIPNGDSLVFPFSGSCTGRQLMRWIGAACCRFCRVTAQGDMEFSWYADSGVTLTKEDRFAGTLSLADRESVPAPASRIITENPLMGETGAENIRKEMAALSYTPCRVTVPLGKGAAPGSIFSVVAPDGTVKRCLVTASVCAGQRETMGNDHWG